MSDPVVEDDEAWLYGDSNQDDVVENAELDEKAEEIENIAIAFGENGEVENLQPTVETPSLPNDAGSKGSDDDDSDDDDDEVQITIGDIKAAPQTAYAYGAATTVNLNLKRGNPIPLAKPKGLDPEAVGTINGINLYDFNLDSLEDKPWRKPGSDITDYFNYGFCEDSWRIYCEKQKKLRTENNGHIKVIPNSMDMLIPIATVNENSKYSTGPGQVGLLKKAGPPPGRKVSGSIDVIGGGTSSLPSRRPSSNRENMIQVMTGRQFEIGSGFPPLHLPPPNYLPPGFMTHPPDLSMPPPMMPSGLIPPNVMGSSSASFPSEAYENYQPSHASNAEDQANYYNGSQYDDSHPPNWPASPRESDSKRDREHRSYNYDANEEYERKHHRDHSDRNKDRDHHYDREDRYERDRERDRGGDRSERERGDRSERDRGDRSERERRHRDREPKDKEERTRSRRRHHHDDDDHRSSRHKHKRVKRAKDEEQSSSKDSENLSKSINEQTTSTSQGTPIEDGD